MIFLADVAVCVPKVQLTVFETKVTCSSSKSSEHKSPHNSDYLLFLAVCGIDRSLGGFIFSFSLHRAQNVTLPLVAWLLKAHRSWILLSRTAFFLKNIQCYSMLSLSCIWILVVLEAMGQGIPGHLDMRKDWETCLRPGVQTYPGEGSGQRHICLPGWSEHRACVGFLSVPWIVPCQ